MRVSVALLLFAALTFVSSNVRSVPPPLSKCSRKTPTGWELVSYSLTLSGHEFNCHYVKRGVR